MNLFKKSRALAGDSSPGLSAPKSSIPAPSSAAHQYNYPPPVFPTRYHSAPSPPRNDASRFPVGTPPEVVRSFEACDANRNDVIDEWELQRALTSRYRVFSARTLRFLMFLFKNPHSVSGLGPSEFAALWKCLGQWQFAFQKYDRDGSGTIDSQELQNVLCDLGYAVPSSVTQMIVSQYNVGSRSKGLTFDQFVESATILRGLTDMFKEKDVNFTGSATLTHEIFMSMVIPFIVP